MDTAYYVQRWMVAQDSASHALKARSQDSMLTMANDLERQRNVQAEVNMLVLELHNLDESVGRQVYIQVVA